jgi:MFS transporter, DHA1 family, tetracycline resistance protein
MEGTHHNPQFRGTPRVKCAVIVVAVSVFLNFTGFTLILPVIPFLAGHYVSRRSRWAYTFALLSLCSRFASFAPRPCSAR